MGRSILACDSPAGEGECAGESGFRAAEREVMRRVAELRREEGLTQQGLALRCGMKPSNYCRLENGHGNPSLETLDRIARGLGRRLRIDFV